MSQLESHGLRATPERAPVLVFRHADSGRGIPNGGTLSTLLVDHASRQKDLHPRNHEATIYSIQQNEACAHAYLNRHQPDEVHR